VFAGGREKDELFVVETKTSEFILAEIMNSISQLRYSFLI